MYISKSINDKTNIKTIKVTDLLPFSHAQYHFIFLQVLNQGDVTFMVTIADWSPPPPTTKGWLSFYRYILKAVLHLKIKKYSFKGF